MALKFEFAGAGLAAPASGAQRSHARRPAGARRGGFAGRPAVDVLEGTPAPSHAGAAVALPTSAKVLEDVAVDLAAGEGVLLLAADEGSLDLVGPSGNRRVTAIASQLLGVPLLSEEELADCQPRSAWGALPERVQVDRPMDDGLEPHAARGA